MSTLKIGNPVASEFVSTFVCEIDAMLGDCDDFKVIELPIEIDQIDCLEALLAKLKITDDCSYHTVDGFHEFFRDHKGSSDENPNTVELPYYAYQSHRYFWYDENGRKFEAEVTEL